MLSKAKRTPIKHSVALRSVCAAHGVTVEGANLMVCQGRKVVFVLRIGTIHSKSCLVKEAPTPSFRRDSGICESGWKTVVVPNGWKVAVIVDNDVWTAEINYSEERDLPQYQFTRLNDEGNVLVQSDWCFTPSGAFKSASIEFIGDENAWGRHNGKLYLGCTYDYPQVFLRQYFQRKLDAGDHKWDEPLKAAVLEWLDPAKQSPKALYNTQNNLGPASYAAKDASLDLDEAAASSAKKPSAENSSSSLGDAAETHAVAESQEATTESPSKRLKFASEEARRAAAVARKRGIRKLTVTPEAVAESEAKAQKRLEEVTVTWITRIWPEVKADMFQSESKLRRLFPGTPAYPSPATQTRAMRSAPGAWLNEDEVQAILFHVDGQVQRIAMEKQMLGNSAVAPGNRNLGSQPAIGYIPVGAVKNIMNAITITKVVGDVVHVRIVDFIARLESIESCAESIFPMIGPMLSLFSIDEIFKRLESEIPEKPKETLDFIRKRMRAMDVDSKDKINVFANATEFCRALTFLPRSSFVNKFMVELHYVASSISLTSPTNVVSLTGSVQAAPSMTGPFMAAPWMAGTPMPAPAFFNMPFVFNPYVRPMGGAWVAAPQMPLTMNPGAFFVSKPMISSTAATPVVPAPLGTNKQ